MLRRLIVIAGFLSLLPVALYAGTTGKIAGVVLDADTGEPLVGANVVLVGTTIGAVATGDGYFAILNIPPGKHEVRATMMGYTPVTMTEVLVVIDLTARVDFSLESTVLEAPDVVEVTAERRIVEKDLTASRALILAEDIEALPVTDLQEIAQLAAGNVMGVFRGGRANGEVMVVVDGVSLRNPLGIGGMSANELDQPFLGEIASDEAEDNLLGNSMQAGFSADIPEDAIAEMEVITGGFNAEYGDASSAIINLVTKEGGGAYTGDFRVLADPGRVSSGLGMNATPDYTLGDPEAIGPHVEDSEPGYVGETRNHNRLEYDFSLGGPEPITTYLMGMPDKANLFLSGNIFGYDGRFRGSHIDQTSLQGKLTYKLTHDYKITFSGLYSERTENYWQQEFDVWLGVEHATEDSFAVVGPDPDWVYDPNTGKTVSDGPEVSDTVWVHDYKMWDNNRVIDSNSYQLTLGWTHTLSPQAFYTLNVGYFETWHDEYQFDPYYRVTEDREVRLKWQEMAHSRFFPQLSQRHGFYVQHPMYSERREIEDRQKVWTFRGDYTNQINRGHQLKSGLELKRYDLFRDYSRVASGDNIYLDQFTVTPLQAAAYLQDKMEFEGLIVNAGLRLDFFDPAREYPDDPANPVDFEHLDDPTHPDYIVDPVDADPLFQLSPRLGVSHPITERAVLHFSYGHFFQLPMLWRFYRNSGYDWHGAFRYIGNPNLDVEKTISYEIGFDQQIGRWAGVDVTAFYKDIKNLIDFKRYNPGERFEFWLYWNSAYANVKGFELTTDLRPTDEIRANVAYTYQIARGRAVSPAQSFSDWYSNKVPRTEDYYLDHDQRHTISAVLSLSAPENWGRWLGDWESSLVWQYGSGRPYSSAARAENPPINDKRYPWTSNTNLSFSKGFDVQGVSPYLLIQVYNLFNRKNLMYIADTEIYEADLDGDGEPDYDPTGAYGNPGVWGPRRTVQAAVGFRF
jgi:outer membrane receptor protein involved in Fe transport